jgi:superfamily II DNA or RNA helicase
LDLQPSLNPHQCQYYAWLLTRRAASDTVESLASTLVDSQVDLNPHQVEAALFACSNPLSRGVILADEVGLGKTIEAGLVISQRWAERRRRILIIVPANLRKQWHQELQDKFNLQGLILEAKNYNTIRKQERQNPFLMASGPVICSYQFAKSKADDIKDIAWDLVVLDEAHRLRNVYKTSNVIAKTLKEALAHVHSKVLLTATPLQNSLLELYGLVSMIDDRVFGDIDSFRSQFTAQPREQAFAALRTRLAPVCKRTLRRQVQQYVPYTARKAIVEEFMHSTEERELSNLVADYLRRPNLKALPEGQRQLISLVLWKLLASSTHAIAGALETMAKRLQGELDESSDVPDLAEVLDEDYESLDETADEWNGQDPSITPPTPNERDAVAQEIAELRHFKTLATNIRDNSKGKALLTALDRAFSELERLGAAKKAIIFTESKRTQEYLLSLLADTSYGERIVLFNGTNSDERAQAVYKDWLKRHEGTDRISGSKTADTRAALVEHFKERGTVMIATEAGAEGNELHEVFDTYGAELARLIRAEMMAHFWEEATECEVQVSRGFTELKPCNYTAVAGQTAHHYRETVTELGKIKQMLFGGFVRCLYPLQKFDSDTERRFAVNLERDTLKWFKPAKGQFQIYYKLGTEQPEYIPDFVAETDSTIFMVETKARTDINTQEVQAKAAAAMRWCRHASDHAATVGAKPWKYLLIPHDEIVESKRLIDFQRFEVLS